ncbi:uncharacterized protein [Apostichopus japonicus]|uniref:uncharacterized protein isoform X3 n=1 Tax=Stichopus japonicus TaxID=307972 RepID=UPI003AB595E4
MELLIFVPRFLLSICAIVCFFPTYSNGQDFFCQALRPANFPTPQPFTTTPYLVITNTTNYEQGNTIEVTVTVKDQSTVTSFSEVFLAASIIGTNEFFGTWTTFMAGQTTEIDCFGGPTVLRFTPPSSQSGIRVLWTLPVDTTTTPPQGFRFTATVVQSDQTFWSLIISETVNIEEIPVVTCPATSSIITNTEGNQIAIWNPPVCLDKEDGPITNRVNCNVTVGSVLPPGDNIIQCMCTDSSENIGTCVFTVTVDGDEAPVVTCPTTSSIITNTEGIEIAVWNNPVCVDEEDGPIENRIDCNVTIGSVLPPGDNIIQCMCTDSSENIGTCVFTVTVDGDEVPDVTCPTTSSIITDTEGNQIAFFNPPECFDKEDGPIIGRSDCNVTTGSVLQPGDNIIQCMCTDSSENIGTCAFTLTAVGDEAPVVTCPTSVSIVTNTEGNQIAIWNPPVCLDKEDGSITNRLNCSVTVGSELPPGDNIIQCMCTDSSENIGTCAFTVTVDGDEAPVVTCPTTSSIVTNTEGIQIAFWNPPVCVDEEDGPIAIRVNCNVTVGSVLPPGDNIIQCMCTDSSENIGTCAFTVTVDGAAPVVPNTPPELFCPNTQSQGFFTEANLPTCTDKESLPNQLTINCSRKLGDPLPNGLSTVFCDCTDESNGMDSCLSLITSRMAMNSPPQLTCMDSVSQGMFQSPSCTDAEDPIDQLTVNCNRVDGEILPSDSTYPISCTCVDTSNAMDSCTYILTVPAMNSPPQLTCMDSVSQGMFQSPSCTDAEDPIDQLTVNCNRVDGEILPSDSTYPISCTCVDTSNATDSCTYILTVPAMNSPPQLTCMDSVSQGMFQSPSCTDAEDPIDQLTVNCNRVDGEILPSDSTYPISCTCVDTSNATDSCTYILTVPAMNSPPQLTCMDSVSQGMFQSPSCTDAEDPIDQLTVNCNRVDGEILPSDSTYPISCTCVDTSNATDSCTYILTVPAMNSPPQLTCMDSVSQGMFQSPSCTDAEDPIDQLTVNCNRVDGEILPSDSTYPISCTCVDTSNAMDSCTYILTVPVRFIGDCDIPMLENTIITCPDSGQVNCSFRCDPGTVNAIQKYGPLACTQTDTSFWEPRPLNGLCQVPVQPTAHSVSFTIPLTTSLVNCRNVTLDSGIETYFQNFFEREQDMFCRESRPLDTECTSGVSLEITGQCAMRTLETRRRRRQTNIDQEVIVLLTLDMTSSLGFQSLSDFSGRFNNSLQTLMVPVQLDVATSSYTVEFSAEDQKTIRATDVSYVCPTGHTYIGEGNCVTCPAGTFFDSVGICELCPSGTFQSLSGQASCIECPESSTTRPGATRRSDCESDTTVNPPPEQSLLKEPFIIAGITLAGTLALCVLLLVIVTCFSCFCQGKETPPKQTNISHSEEPTEYHVRSYDNHELRTDDEVEVALQDYATRASDEDSTGYNDNHYAYDAPPSKNDTLDPSSDTESLRMRPTTQL